MTKLPADLEALMPEPFGYVPFPGEFYPPDELDAEVKNDPAVPSVFTADQVREAMLAATERAAKLCEAESERINGLANAHIAFGRINYADRLAAAIRSGGEAGS